MKLEEERSSSVTGEEERIRFEGKKSPTCDTREEERMRLEGESHYLWHR